MTAEETALWMADALERDSCLYQDDVVDHLVRSRCESLLRENADGNLVIGRPVLNAFKKLNAETVVWVRRERYWRYRVAEDEPGRDARG